MSKPSELLERVPRFIRFCCIGGASFLFSVSLMLFWVEYLHLPYLTATALTWLSANCFSFFLNKNLTFRTAGKFWRKEIVRYFFVMGCNFLFSMAFMFVMVDIFGVHYLLSSIAMAGFMLSLNYVAHKLWSFNTGGASIENDRHR